VTDLSNRVFTNADQEVVEYDGSPVTWRVSAYVIVEKDDKILLLKNRTEKLYDIPGGGVEIGESVEEAVAREAMEEAGATVKLGDLIHYKQGWFKHGNGNFYQTLQLCFRAELVGELMKPTEADIEWVDFVSKEMLDKYPLPAFVLEAIGELRSL
jgi:8-oxo-dGTP pyrophosphatase MutT (NUDIX family)